MVSSVKSRPNHYQTLGIEPSASAERISEAFAKKMSLFALARPGAAAELCIAHETLRDPVKRREHDRSLGLNSKVEQPLAQWSYAIRQARWTPLTPSAARQPSENRGGEMVLTAEPHVIVPQSEAPVDPRLASIARSVRELAKPAVPPASAGPKPERREASRPEREAELSLEEVVQQIRAVGRMEKASLSEPGHNVFEWKRPAFTLGGLLVAAGIFGALAGLSLKGDEAPAEVAGPGEPSLIHHQPRFATLSASPGTSAPEASAKTPTSRFVPALRPKRQNLNHDVAAPLEPAMAGSATDTNSLGGNETEALEQNPPSAELAQPAANLPLSRAIIARTIERIGYPCGKISSASTIDGETTGTFQVTCSSGNSYRATPVGGHYRFRRAG